MKAMVFDKFQQTPSIQTVPDPTCAKNGVIVQVQATGICRSDWHGWMGHDDDVQLPHVPGHELAGTVLEVGSEVTRFSPQDRITVPFSMGCGQCDQCQTQNHQVCDRYFQPGFTGWGSFAEMVHLPFADLNLVRLPDAMSFEEASTLGCRFVTAYRAIVSQAKLKPGEWFAVHGCGGVGLSAIMIGSALGANVIGIDVQPDALQLAKKLGAAEVIDASKVDVVSAIQQFSKTGAHVSIDALGSRQTCLNSIAGLRKRGRHVQIGLMAESDQDCSALWPQVISKELEIYGSHGISATEYGTLFDLIGQASWKMSDLIQRRVNLTEGIQVLTEMQHASPIGVTIINDFS